MRSSDKLSSGNAAPSVEEAERRVRGRPTLLASVTPEILAAFDAFEGTKFVGRQESGRKSA